MKRIASAEEAVGKLPTSDEFYVDSFTTQVDLAKG
jgi:hypothetical protein